MTMFTYPPKKTRSHIEHIMDRGLVPFVQSSPGLGKSAIFRQIAKARKLKLIDVRLSQCAPEDLMGLPMRTDENRATFAPFEMFPIAGMELPKGYLGWLLFLDEFNSASKSVQAAAYKPVLDHMVGMFHLHEKCYVAAAGNLATDKAIVNSLGTAMQSRVVHLEMVASQKDFIEYAVSQYYDPRIIGFLEFQPSKLHVFKPDHQDRTFACPRTWEFVSKLITGVPTKDIDTGLIAGAISDGVATEFAAFIKEYDKLPSYQSIMKAPTTLPIPSEAGTCYAVITMLLDLFDEDDFDDVVKYVRRLSPEFQIIYFRGIKIRNYGFIRTKSFRENITHLTKFLFEDDDEEKEKAA